MIVNNRMEWIWKEIVVGSFKVISQHYLAPRKTTKSVNQVSVYPGRIGKRHLPDTSLKLL